MSKLNLKDIESDPRVESFHHGSNSDQILVKNPAELEQVCEDYGLTIKMRGDSTADAGWASVW